MAGGSEVADSLKILVVSQFFTPEMGAPAARFHDFGRLLVERGHEVTLLTGFSNSPAGIVPEAYRGRLRMHEEIDGVQVRRVWLYASPRLSTLTKSLGFASFAADASLSALFANLSADVVIATSPPPTVAIPGILAARRLRAGLVVDIRDIWPEAILQSGRLRSRTLVRALEAVERRAYQTADAITVVTEGKRARLIEKGVPPEKIEVLPNGVDLSRFASFGKDEAPPSVLQEHGVDPGRFLVLYAGVFNPPQGLDVLLDAMRALTTREPELAEAVQLVLVGDGSQRERLQARARREGLSQLVKFLPIQPREGIPSLLRAADALAVTLRPRRDVHTIPSKIYECLASGRPVLVSADGAPAEIIAESGAGLASPAGDAAALADSLHTLVHAPDLRREMGRKGKAFARGSDRRLLVASLETTLQRVVARRQR